MKLTIDPEDREQIGRLLGAYFHEFHHRHSNQNELKVETVHIDAFRAALRALDRPDEPTGQYAVIEDDKGREWVAIDPQRVGYRWQLIGEPHVSSGYATWADVAAVRVLSEGVQS